MNNSSKQNSDLVLDMLFGEIEIFEGYAEGDGQMDPSEAEAVLVRLKNIAVMVEDDDPCAIAALEAEGLKRAAELLRK